jgi:SNF2 family DNA or RNA helicase
MSSEDALERAHSRLRKIRKRTDLTLPELPNLKRNYTHFDGTVRPLEIRYYQVQGALHLIVMARFVLGDDCGIGKTLQTICALCYLWRKKPNQKVIIVTDKSAVIQWVDEFGKFTKGVHAIPYLGIPEQPVKRLRRAIRNGLDDLQELKDTKTPKDPELAKKIQAKIDKLVKSLKRWKKELARAKKSKVKHVDRSMLRKEFKQAKGPTVLVMNYALARIDFSELQEWKDYIIVFDECQAFKTPGSQIHQVCSYFASRAVRAWGLTATLIQNKLMEGYGIYKCIMPNVFGTKRAFMYDYGIVTVMSIGNRKIPKVTGHTKEHIEKFKKNMSPYYLGRAKFEVASELPSLTIKTVHVELSPIQAEKYDEALTGLLEMGDGEIKETTKLTQISYCQQIVDHPQLIGIEGDCPRMEMVIDLITTGEFGGEKVIISSRFRRLVDILEKEFKKRKIKCVRVTGAENDKKRAAAMKTFQDMTSGTDVIFITDAGKQAINLQAAKAIIFYDTDFSGGVFLQKIGRMIRIGSPQDRCYAIHLVAKRARGAKSIDHRAMEILDKKIKLIEAVLGKRIKGDGDPTVEIDDDNDITQLFAALSDDARDLAK